MTEQHGSAVAYWLALLRDGSPEEKLAARYHLADVFEERGMLVEASELLESNLQAGDQSRALQSRLSQLYVKQGRLDALRQLRQQSPQSTEATSSRAEGVSDGWTHDPGLPFRSFDDLLQAISAGEAQLSPRQDVARNWAGSVATNLTRKQLAFYYFMSWTPIWTGITLTYLSWGIFGYGSLWLNLVAWLSAMINRPWMGNSLLAFSALIAVGAYFTGYQAVVWGAGTWLIVGIMFNSWHNWCTNLFEKYLLSSEEIFLSEYKSRIVGVFVGGKRYLAESVPVQGQ